MTVVDKEIISGNNDSIKSLEEVTEFSKNLIEVINSFIEDSKDKLTGEGYEKVRERLEFYCSALETQQKLSKIVQNNFTIGNNLMIKFMGDFSNLDNADLESIQNTLYTVKNNIYELQNRINVLEQEEDGGDTLRELKQKLEEWKAIAKQYQILVEKLECLDNTDSSILSYLSDTYTDCTNFSTAVNEIQVTQIN